MENREDIPLTRKEKIVVSAVAAAAIGLAALTSAIFAPREPNAEQLRNPQFVECVQNRLAHDDFSNNHMTGPQGVPLGPTDRQLSERRCMDDVFPEK